MSMKKPAKVVLEAETAAIVFDLSGEPLGEKVVLDYGSGGHLHITPYDGETAVEVLKRAREACVEHRHDPLKIGVCADPEMYAPDYDPEACIR